MAVGESALIVSLRGRLWYIYFVVVVCFPDPRYTASFSRFISSSSITASQHSLRHAFVRTQISKL